MSALEEFNADRVIAAAKALKGLTGINVLSELQGQLSPAELDHAEKRMPIGYLPYYSKYTEKIAGLTPEQEMILRLCNELEKVHAECRKAFCSTDKREVIRVNNILRSAANTVEKALAMEVFK